LKTQSTDVFESDENLFKPQLVRVNQYNETKLNGHKHPKRKWVFPPER